MLISRFLFLLAFLFTAPLLGQEQVVAACDHCKGKGQVKLECMACEGERKVGCSDCSAHVIKSSQRREWKIALLKEGELTAEKQGAHLVKLSYIAASSAQPNFALNPGPGMRNCPTGIPIFSQHGECKLCKNKGKVRCKGCKGKALGTCPGCSGKGSFKGPCVVCKGSGQEVSFPRLSKDSAPDCGWCKGTMLTTCGTCVDSKPSISTCHDCQGRKAKLCKDCSGLHKMGCKACRGRGMSGLPSPSGKGPKCRICKGKRAVACTSCKRGKITCETCLGKGKAQWSCPDCVGKPATLCPGCVDGETRYWEAAASYWKARGDTSQVTQYLNLAIQHKTQYLAQFEDACEVATKALAIAEAEQEQAQLDHRSPFIVKFQGRWKWLEDHRLTQVGALRTGLKRLRKMQTTD